MALSVATGEKIWRRYACTQAPVIHIDYEQGDYLSYLRYQRMAHARGIDLARLGDLLRFVSASSLYLDSAGAEAAIVRLIRESRAGFVFVDSLKWESRGNPWESRGNPRAGGDAEGNNSHSRAFPIYSPVGIATSNALRGPVGGRARQAFMNATPKSVIRMRPRRNSIVRPMLRTPLRRLAATEDDSNLS
jgi:hypothetical protein